jgi:hypothetical protein
MLFFVGVPVQLAYSLRRNPTYRKKPVKAPEQLASSWVLMILALKRIPMVVNL